MDNSRMEVRLQMTEQSPPAYATCANSTASLYPESTDPEQPKIPPRETWARKAEFLLSCIGFSVGLGNLWRFPYVAYENGGGAFLLPYFILLLLVGKPMYLMELIIGQFSGLGPMSVWRCFPIATGVGSAMITISMVVSIYYNLVMAYTVYYFGQSFRKVLPWSGCFEWWGADANCYVRSANQSFCADAVAELLDDYGNKSRSPGTVELRRSERLAYVPEGVFTFTLSNCSNATQTSSEQFFEKYVLNISSGIDHLGSIKWDLAVTLLVCWAIIFLILVKGIKSVGKVVYFTATFPYVILIVLVGYGVAQDGALDGIRFFFIPKWEKLLDLNVWRNAAEQLLYSLGVSWGSLIVFSSYNKFENKVHRDAYVVSSLDFLTSLIAGIVIFSVLGNMAHTMNIDISSVVKGEQGLAFIAYPEALAQLHLPHLWAVLFFFMLFLLAVDSQFSYLETLFAAIHDEFPSSRRYKTLICFTCCFVCFLLGLPCTTQGGPYVLKLMDSYGGGFALLFVAICELLAIMWGYGVNNFCNDIEFMLGYRPGIYWKVCWAFVAPVVLMFLFVYALVKHEVVAYAGKPYPMWADGIGWFLALISMVQIPIVALFLFFRNIKNPTKILTPRPDWGPSDPEVKLRYRKFVAEVIGNRKRSDDTASPSPNEENHTNEERGNFENVQ